jgi:hypothetical protein
MQKIGGAMETQDLLRTLLRLGQDQTLTREQYKRRVQALRDEITAFAGNDRTPPVARSVVLRGMLVRLTNVRPAEAAEPNPEAELQAVLAELDRPGRGRRSKGELVTARLPADVLAWMGEEVLRRGIPVTANDTGFPELLRQLLAEAKARQERGTGDLAASE